MEASSLTSIPKQEQDDRRYFASRETLALNDCLLHWLEEGEQGIQWPAIFARYELIWPEEIPNYSHYVTRATASTAEAIEACAVPLPSSNIPAVQYQDATEGGQDARSGLTSDYRFYTRLDTGHPVHRTLLRFTAGAYVAFERVFSWMEEGLTEEAIFRQERVARRYPYLSAIMGDALWDVNAQAYVWGGAQNQFFTEEDFADPGILMNLAWKLIGPDPVSQYLVQRFSPESQWALYSFNWNPFEAYAFLSAALVEEFNKVLSGPSIYSPERFASVSLSPETQRLVNANPQGATLILFNRLLLADAFSGLISKKPWADLAIAGPRVIRAGAMVGTRIEAPADEAGRNGGNLVGHINTRVKDVTLDLYDANPGIYIDPLTSGFEAASKGSIIPVNSLPGRETLEVWWFRDNKGGTVGANAGDKSRGFDTVFWPSVIGRYAIGWPADGSKIVLASNDGSGTLSSREASGKIYYQNDVTKAGFNPNEEHALMQGGEAYALRDDLNIPGSSQPYVLLEYTADDGRPAMRTFRVLREDDENKFDYNVAAGTILQAPMPLPLLNGMAQSDEQKGEEQTLDEELQVRCSALGNLQLALRSWCENPPNEGWGASFPRRTPEQCEAMRKLLEAIAERMKTCPGEGETKEPGADLPPDLQARYRPFTLIDRKGNTWVYRGPHDDDDQAVMAMQFYYKTLDGFYFPEESIQPPVGTVTPYLRVKNTDTGQYLYGGAYGNADADPYHGDGNALPIFYRPVWPTSAPVLMMGETLTTPKRGLPAVRGQTSLEVYYQQSQVATDAIKKTVVLHDPTRKRIYEFGETGLTGIPDSVVQQVYRGKIYFPKLPAHLSERFYVDPNQGENGALVLEGKFIDEPVGEKYLQLNVLGAADREYLKALCADEDVNKEAWDDVVEQGLKTKMELFANDASKPGTYTVASSTSIGPESVCEVTDDDVAVDSYALTAVGPGTGYVTLLAGNGEAFTPPEEPVSVQVIKVVSKLFPGEVKVLANANPLSETLALQQVIDLAGQASDFKFDWRIAAPVDGFPPKVYEQTPAHLFGYEPTDWKHLPFPTSADFAGDFEDLALNRLGTNILSANYNRVTPVTVIAPRGSSISVSGGDVVVHLANPTQLTNRNQIVVWDPLFGEFQCSVSSVDADRRGLRATLNDGQPPLPGSFSTEAQVYEPILAEGPQSILSSSFTLDSGKRYSQYWLSLDLAKTLGVEIYLDGQLVVTANLTNNTALSHAPANLNPLADGAYLLKPEDLAAGTPSVDGMERHWFMAKLYSSALPGVAQDFRLKLDAYEVIDLTEQNWNIPLPEDKCLDGIRAVLGGKADVRALSDNYLIMRYQATNATHASHVWGIVDGTRTNVAWSDWTTPQLAEGWIKRVLAGINPFNQRTKDLFNNRVNTDASMLTQAGHRYEGDIALNLDAINKYGLIEIYETVMNRGKMLSIGAGINYGPANDALLLAAGYLNDLYMMAGNEAYADAANPTIGIGTADKTYGDIATALFSFKGQMASLLDEELALLRGRDDVVQPGVELPPVYNRLFWNYTRGIDAGEVVYALNYNIQENPDQAPDGIIDAADAARMYPMGHGDAYGHYLTALKGYYSLLLNKEFDWVPRIEAVTVLGVPVSVDYQDERKFAAVAAAVARTGRQIFDLTWRHDYDQVQSVGWAHFATNRINSSRKQTVTRQWGMDHWASRTGQGAFVNWLVGNAILPAVDPNPYHEGIQKIDRTTVPELREIATAAEDLQTAMDNAESGLSPLGIPEGGIAFDINPSSVVGVEAGTHFEQIYQRALIAFNNAVAAFDDAKDVTRLMRSEQDSLADFQNSVARQELAYSNALIELYGTPYADDIGPGKTYVQGYTGPDLLHYTYVELPELDFPQVWNYYPEEESTFHIDIQDLPGENGTGWLSTMFLGFDGVVMSTNAIPDSKYILNTHYIDFPLGPHGFHGKPTAWTGQRASPGKLQNAISERIAAYYRLRQSLWDSYGGKDDMDKAIRAFNSRVATLLRVNELQAESLELQNDISKMETSYEITSKWFDIAIEAVDLGREAASDLAGGEFTGTALPMFPGILMKEVGALKSATCWAFGIAKLALMGVDAAEFTALKGTSQGNQNKITEIAKQLATLQFNEAEREGVLALAEQMSKLQGNLATINVRLREWEDTDRACRSLVAAGDRIQEERLVFRQRAAAIVQGYRTRDAAFRVFRNEKLERYKTLFDLAARYALLAVNAYDYETGLLNTPQGSDFRERVMNARALGVVRNGEPQFGGSDTGDPGLSSVLAEMKADWDILRGRLGFNNPDAYGTTVSLRTECQRLNPPNLGGQEWTESDADWRKILEDARKDNLLEDSDVRRYCMQIGSGSDLAVPGLVLKFSTCIEDGVNLFGNELAPGDHVFSPSSFATKIFAVGVALEGYRGMARPPSVPGGHSAADPSVWFLDETALAATPYVYLIPVGIDSMRSPPLGDASQIRSWSVDDLAIPMPFNIGGSGFSNRALWQSSDSLTEPLFAVRKHQAFRPVSSEEFFTTGLYGSTGSLLRSEFTNNRLVGRSVWNSQWKLVIPGKTLLHDPDEGLDRFIRTVKDIKLHLVTYSYSGN
ncbi:MAG: hypothetical protein AB9869_00265 [Verrucomicrobiia bacterium]